MRSHTVRDTPRARAAGVLAGLVAWLSLAMFSSAQPPIPELALEPDTAHVGDPVTLTLTLPGTVEGDSILWPDVREQLGELTVLSADTLTGRAARDFGGSTLALTVAAYDTGHHGTGPLEFEVNGEAWTLPSDSLYIATLLTDSTATEFRPLKGQEELRWTFWDWLRYYGPWVGGVLLAALLVWLAWRWWKRRGKNGDDADGVEPEPDPYPQAVEALAALKADNPLARGDMKEYVSRLVFIGKRLLERTYDEPVLEMTSTEVRRWARARALPFAATSLNELLTASDVVKFARGTLDKSVADGLFGTVEYVVEAHKPRPETESDTGTASTAPPSASPATGTGANGEGRR